MSVSSDYQVKFSNSATKPITGVLFADATSGVATSDPCSVWAIFKDRKTSTLTIPSATQMRLECYDASGDRILLGPYDCVQYKYWVLQYNEEGSLSLEPSEPLDQASAATAAEVITIDLSSVGEDAIDGRVYLYKDERIYLIRTLNGHTVTIPSSPALYFGLTSTQIDMGDTFTNRKLFSSVAQIDMSYYDTGMCIEVTDSPAKRPHVNIMKL